MGLIETLAKIIKAAERDRQKKAQEEEKRRNSGGSKNTAAASSTSKSSTNSKPYIPGGAPSNIPVNTTQKTTTQKTTTQKTATQKTATQKSTAPTPAPTPVTAPAPLQTFKTLNTAQQKQKEEEQKKDLTPPMLPLRKSLELPQRLQQLHALNTNTLIETSLKKDIEDKRAAYSESDVRETYDVDAGGTNVNGNTQYKVNTVTAVDYRKISDGLADGTLEVWLIEEGDGIKHTEYANRTVEDGVVTTAVNTIGADRLNGIDTNDKCVIYDPATQKFYRYAQSDDVNEKRRTIESYATQMSEYTNDYVNNTAAKFETTITQLDAVLQPLVDKAETTGLTDEEYALFQATWEKRQAVVTEADAAYDAYATNYTDVLEKYNAVNDDLKGVGITGREVEQYYALRNLKMAQDNIRSGKGTDEDRKLLTSTYGSTQMSQEDINTLNALSSRINNATQNTVYMNEDYMNALNDYADNIRTEIEAYKQDATMYAEFDSTTQVNSLLDVAKRAISRAAWGQFEDTTIWEDLAEMASYKTTAISKVASEEDATAFKVGGAILNSALVELGEDLDVTNVFKSFIAGSNNYVYGNYDNPELNVFIREQAQKEWNALSASAKSFWQPTAGTHSAGRDGVAEYAGWVSFKAWLGAYGETPNFDYINAVSPEERNFNTMLLTTTLDLMFDPGVWADLGKMAVKSSAVADALDANTVSNLLDRQYTVWKNAGATIIDEGALGADAAQQLARELAENGTIAVVRNTATDQAIVKSYTNAIKRAYEAGGNERVMREALTQTSMQATENMFSKALGKKSDTVGAYLQGLDNLDTVAKSAHTAALDAFTNSAAHTAIKNIGEIAKEDGDVMARLIYQAPKVVGTMHALDSVEAFVNKSLLSVAAPALAVPVATTRGIKKLLTKTTNLDLAKLAAESVGTLTKKLSDMTEATKAFSDNVADAAKEITEYTSVLYANAGYTKESYKFFKELEDNALRAYADYVLADTLTPIKQILTDTGYNPVARINALDKWAAEQGFASFKECSKAIERNIGIFSDMSDSAKAMYSEFQRLYRSAVAAKNIEGTQQLIQKVYNTGTANITKQLDAVLNGSDVLTELQNMHTTVQVMRDQFVDMITGVAKKDYADTAKSVIDAIKDLGDNVGTTNFDNAKYATLSDAVHAFNEMTDKYVVGLNEHIGKVKTANYVHTAPTEYISRLSDKVKALQRTQHNTVAAGIRKELQRHQGLNVSVEEIQENLVHSAYKDILFDANGEIDVEGLRRIYQVQLDKYTGALQWTSDDAMRKVVDDVLNINTETNCALRNLETEIQAVLAGQIPTDLSETLYRQLADINEFVDQCARQKHTRLLFDNFENAAATNGVDDRQINAVLDAMAGDKSHSINRNAMAYMDTLNQRHIDNIVDSIVDDATEYLREVSETPIDYLWHRQCNTVNTADNVRRIAEEAKRVVPADEQFIDVYYSTAGTVRGADPHLVSFKVGDAVSTFRNADSPFMLHDSHARKMYGKSYAEVTEEYLAVCDEIPGVSKVEYAQQIQCYMLQLNKQATDQGKQLRFIGFNSGAATSESDKFIKNFFISNNIGVRWNSTVDVAEIIRRANGMEYLPDEAVAAIRRSVTDTLASARTNKYLHNVSGALIMDAEKPFTSVADGLSTTVESIKTFMQAYSDDTQRVLNDLFTGIERTKHVIDESRKIIGGDDMGKLLSEREIAEFIDTATLGKAYSTRIDNMRALYGTLSDVRSASSGSYGLRKTLDMSNVTEWFNKDALARLIKTTDKETAIAARIEDLTQITKGLDRHYQLVSNPELLEAIGEDAYREVYDVVLTMLQHNPKMVGSNAAELLSELNLNTAQDYFSALMYLQKKYATAFPSLDDVYKQLSNLNARGALHSSNWQDAWCTIGADTASELVYNSTHTIHRFGTSTKIIETKYATVNEQAVRTHAAMQEAVDAAKTAESLGTYLDLKEIAYRKGNYLTAEEHIQYELFSKVYEPYLDLVDTLNINYPHKDAVKSILEDVNLSPVQRATAIRAYDEDIAAQLRVINDVGNTHKTAAVAAALTLSDADFETYVVRNCMNALVIDPNAAMFKGDLGVLLGKRLDTITNSTGLIAERFTKLDVNGNAHEYIRVYKDLSNVDMDKLLTELWDTDVPLVDAYRGAYAKYAPSDVTSTAYGAHVFEAFNKYTEEVAQYMPDRYFGSTMDVLTQDTMAALQADFPEFARINTARIKDWFDESYNCSIWGDISTQRIYNPYASDKLLDNMGRGLHHVQYKMEATANIVNMFNNPSQSLRNMVKAVGAEDVSWKTIKQQLESRGYVLAVIKPTATGSYIATQMPLDSARAFKKYMQSDTVVCLENSVFNHLNAAVTSRNKLALYNKMHGNIVTGTMADMYSTWTRTVRSARITGTLFLSNFKGTGIRNIIDSTLKGFNDAGSNFIKYVGNAIEYQRGYDEVYAAIIEKYHDVNSASIAKYFSESTGAVIDEELFTKLHVLNSLASSDSSVIYDVIKNSELPKMRGLLADTAQYTDDELRNVQNIFNHVHAKAKYANIPGELKYTVQSAMYEEVLAKLNKQYAPEQAKELAELFYHYTPTATTWGQKLENVPGIGALIKTNAKTFSDAETRTRTAMYLAYVDEMGESVNKAEQAIIRTQFDYSNRPGILNSIEKLLPFSTFKVYNANYWMNEATKKYSTMRNITKLSRATNPTYDAQEIATIIRNQHITEMMRNQQEDTTEEDGTDGIRQWWQNSILGYKGVPDNYAQGLRIGDNHVLKIGNSFVDAITLMANLWYAPQQIKNGQLPSIIADSMYAPLATLWNFLADYRRNDGINPTDVSYGINPEGETNAQGWALSNMYDVLNTIPAYGALANMVLTHIKNGSANLADFKAMLCDETFRDAYMHKLFEGMIDGAGTILPSFVGITYEPNTYFEREVGLNWSNNTNPEFWMTRINPETGTYYTAEEAEAAVEEYRATHQYVYGVSNIPSFMGKDPATYINYSAMFVKWGFDEADVKEHLGLLLSQLYGGGFEQDAATNGVFFNADGKGGTYLNSTLINDTLAALAAKGYSVEEAIECMKSEKWYNPYTGQFITDTDLYKEIANAAFLDVYERLPEYMRYDKDQYSQLMAYWKATGLTTQQAWMMMQSENGFIDEQGRYRVLTDEQVAQYTKQLNEDYYEFTDTLPDWYKYETGAATRAINYLTDVAGMSKEDAYKYIIENNFYIDEDGKHHYFTAEESAAKTAASSKEFEEYYSALPEYIKYEKGAYGRTLSYLKEVEGVDTITAKQMIANGAYLTVDGRLINCLDMQREYSPKWTNYLSGDEFTNYYQSLPNYIKYEKGAFKRTYNMLKELGFDYTTSLELIKQGAYLMPTDANSSALRVYNPATSIKGIADIDTLLQVCGNQIVMQDDKAYTIVNCSGLVRMNARGSYYSNKYYNNYQKYRGYSKQYTPRAPKIKKAVRHYTKPFHVRKPFVTNKSYSSTYSKVNVLAGASYGARKAYKVTLGYNPVRQSLSIKSCYPAAYRNIVYSTRRNMYKDLYAKYGTSRMQMRSNATHSYSNAAITRLRRNEIQNRIRYANRRSNF